VLISGFRELDFEFERIVTGLNISVQKLGNSILVTHNLKVISARFFVSFLISSEFERFSSLKLNIKAFCIRNGLVDKHMNISMNGLPWIVNMIFCLYIKKTLLKGHFQGQILYRSLLTHYLFINFFI